MKHFLKCSIHKLFAKSNFNKVLFFFFNHKNHKSLLLCPLVEYKLSQLSS